MTLEEFLQNYGGNACISIDGYCEEANYDFGQMLRTGNFQTITQTTTNRPA